MRNSELPIPVSSAELAETMRYGLEFITAYRNFSMRSITAQSGQVTIEAGPIQQLNELFIQGHIDQPPESGIVEGIPSARVRYTMQNGEHAEIYGRAMEGDRVLTDLEHESAYAIVEFMGKIATPVHGATVAFHNTMPPSLVLDIPYPEEREHRRALIDTLYRPTLVRTGKDGRTFSNHRVFMNTQGGGDLNIAVREPKDAQRLVRIPRRRFASRQFES